VKVFDIVSYFSKDCFMPPPLDGVVSSHCRHKHNEYIIPVVSHSYELQFLRYTLTVKALVHQSGILRITNQTERRIITTQKNPHRL